MKPALSLICLPVLTLALAASSFAQGSSDGGAQANSNGTTRKDQIDAKQKAAPKPAKKPQARKPATDTTLNPLR